MFKGIIGHKETLKLLENDLKTGLFSHAYLFCGPEGVGKFTIAKKFARNILCVDNGCEKCSSCRNFEKGSHPDFLLLDNSAIGIEEAKDIQRFLSLKPYFSRKKVVLINDSEKMTREAANCLLKTLEEPSQNSIIILIAKNKNRLLQTIISRCRIIIFGLVSRKEINDNNVSSFVLGKPEPIDGPEIEDKDEKDKILEKIPILFKEGDYKEKFEIAQRISESKDIKGILDYMSFLFRNLAIQKITNGDIVVDKKICNFIDNKDLNIPVILDVLSRIERIKASLRTGINIRLSIEALILKIEGI